MADDRGRPVAILLTPGNVSDIVVAGRIAGAVAPSGRLLADRAYDAEAVVPSTRPRKKPFPFNRRAYARRNVVERLFCRLKNWRRIATRYDRLARNDLSATALVAAVAAWAV